MYYNPKYDQSWNDAINRELNGEIYTFEEGDRELLKEMCDEIYASSGKQVCTIYELITCLKPSRIAPIINKYILGFKSEYMRSHLLYSIILDSIEIENMDELVVQMYRQFRLSKYNISPPGPNKSWVIYMKYDNILAQIKSKKYVPEIIEWYKSLREMDRLAVTLHKIARKWRPKELEQIMVGHLLNTSPTRADIDLPETGDYRPTLEYIYLQSRFNAISALKYYPSERNRDLILTYADHEYKELSKFAKKTAEKMDAKLKEMKENG
ncbi:MAG: hypothetical protein E7627_04855 [Ruminococcaceae bacterium]|nr:hypothetical protein [Oscillospiraceae bacterium]